MKDYTGHTIVDGELHHASVSGVKSFDIRTKGGCPRRWAWDKVFGNKADAFMNTEAKDKGTALDVELKNYLRTGDKTLSSLALKGLHILEAPGPDLGLDIAISTVEHYAPRVDGMLVRIPSLPDGEHHKYPPGTVHKVQSALTAAGVPFVGELDMAHARGHYRDDEGEYHEDPPGTVEVLDIKFKTNATDRNGNNLYFLPTDMIRDVQMSGYGEWVRRVRPETTHVRLSMLYFPEKKGLPTKVTRLHVIDEFPKAWARVESVVREMKDVARATDIEQVPGAPDISTCDAYAGCPHREYCTAYRRNSLDKTYGKMAEDHLQEKQMGLLANNPGMMNQALAAPDMRQQLAAEEAQQRAAVAQQQQQMPQQLNMVDFQQACIRLQNYGYGFPTLAGNAAQAYAALGGQSVAPGFVYPGTPAAAGARRSLHGVQLTEVAHVYQIERELSQEAAQNAPAQPAPVMMQQAPPAPQMQTYQAQPVAQATPVMKTMDAPGLSFLPPDAPQSMPQLAMQGGPQQDLRAVNGDRGTYVQTAPAGAFTSEGGNAMQGGPQPGSSYGLASGQALGAGISGYVPQEAEQATAPAQPAVEAPKKKGRPPKAQPSQDATTGAVAASAPASPPPQPAPASQAAPVASSPSAPAVALSSALTSAIFVNARVAANDSKSLSEYVDYINAELSKRYCVGSDGRPTVQDVRCAPKDSVLAFGGWKGAVREVVKADPPPPGIYHLDTFTDELGEVVADALRVVAEQRGWLYVRGVRW